MTTDGRLVARLTDAEAGSADGADPAAADRLHTRLVNAAAGAGLLDVAYRTVPTPIGTLLLAATSEGLVRIAFDLEGHDAVLATIAARVSPRILHAPARLDDAARQLDEYFAGHRRSFDLAVDLRLASPFRRVVLEHLRTIGYGRTESYATVATASGSPAAVRAVGSACATNPVPVVVPCHRVVRSDGTLGGYLGGLDVKRTLLALETARGSSVAAAPPG
jgi:methylated-DNA-[protein]-cysteine S-methyltransferase